MSLSPAQAKLAKVIGGILADRWIEEQKQKQGPAVPDTAGEIIYHDGDGTAYVLDEAGNRRPPLRAAPNAPASGFTTYPTEAGHCALCGRPDCNGGCFR